MFDFTKSKKKLNKEINELRKSLATKEALLVREGKKEGVFVLTTAERILVDSELKRVKMRNPRLSSSLDSVEGWRLILQAKGGGIPSENDLYKALMADDTKSRHTDEEVELEEETDDNLQTPDVILSGTANSSGVKSHADALRAGQLSADADTGAAILEIAAT